MPSERGNAFTTFPAAYRKAQEGRRALLHVRGLALTDLYYFITTVRLAKNGSTKILIENLRNRYSLSYKDWRELAYQLVDSSSPP